MERRTEDSLLTVLERALADEGFLRDLLRRPAEALAAAGLALSADDLDGICRAVAAAGADPGALVGALVAQARQRGA